jgi:Zn-dependent oligopeptidase
MSADTWQAFLEAGGPWDKAVAARLRKYNLAEGNATDRAEAYRRFRGRNPDVRRSSKSAASRVPRPGTWGPALAGL